MLSSKSWQKNPPARRVSLQKNTPNVNLFSQKSRDFTYFYDSVTKFGQGVTQAFLDPYKKKFPCVEFNKV